jgi:hypothetical protein
MYTIILYTMIMDTLNVILCDGYGKGYKQERMQTHWPNWINPWIHAEQG